METDANVQRAEERKTRLRELIRRSITFAIICGYLSVVNHFTFPYPWVLWVIGAWGNQRCTAMDLLSARLLNRLKHKIMEEKKLNEQESLALITSMINDTRERLAENSGRPFLIWGYTSIAV